MGKSFVDKVDESFVSGAKEHAHELNIMYAKAAQQKVELEKQAMQGPKIFVEEIVVDTPVGLIDNNGVETKLKEEDFVL